MAWTERYVRSDAAGGGDGTTDTNSGANGAWTLAEAIASASGGQRVNIRAGTYSNTTTDRTFGTSGTTTAPIWWRGFNTNIGDIDTDNTLTKPAITFTTGRFMVTGAYQIFSNLDISGAQVSNGQVRTNTGADNIWFDRCRIQCTSANSNGRAVFINSTNNNVFTRCWLDSNTSSTGVFETNAQGCTIIGCKITGGSSGLIINAAVNSCIAFNTFDVSGDAIKTIGFSGNRIWILCNTFYSCGSDGIDMSLAPNLCCVINNIFSESGGYGINNASGGNIATVIRLFNLFHSNTSGNENGFGDTPSIAEQSDSSSPFVSSSDLSIKASSNAKANGIPKDFENASYTSYMDIGAVQRQESGSTGGTNIRGGFVN